MHISRVELENFKSHENSAYEFECGTTSICGENGAGKTSIIEAVAWTIFDTLDYRKEDIVRRGAKKGIARVTFESGLDERPYTVYRDTGTGYYVFDPQLKARIADKKEEVKRFLWQHLGIEPGTDLESLFKHAIGVPQGTFTSIFLATATERKKTFDSLLKVEEYRRSSDELLKTVRYVEQQISSVNVKIARSEGEISRIDQIEQDRQNANSHAAEWRAQLAVLESDVTDKQQTLAVLDEAENKLSVLWAEAERLRSDAAKAKVVKNHCELDLSRSREAEVRVAETRADAEAHQNSLGKLQELDRERTERQKLRDALSELESALQLVKTEQRHLQQDIDKLQSSHGEIASLRTLAADQDKLEHDLALKRQEFAKVEGAAEQLSGLEPRLNALRDAYRDAVDRLSAARDMALRAVEVEFLTGRDAEIVRELANANAALERDERFQQEIRNGLCPILSQKCLNLSAGQTLESFVTSQFGELRTRINVLATEQVTVSNDLRSAREAERSAAQISVLETRVKEIGDEGNWLKSQKAELESETSKLSRVKQEIERIEQDLKTLDNPKARISMLEKEVLREGEVREQISSSEKNLERLESDRRITVEKLEAYKDLDALLEKATSLRDRTVEAYRLFVANETLASQFAENQKAFEAARIECERCESEAAKAEANLSHAAGGYDREHHLALRSALSELHRKQTEAGVMLSSLENRTAELAAEAERLYEIRKSMQAEFHEREKLQKVAETTDFIRSTLREAAPLVARNYVHHVSLEANQMFREIRGDAECSLKWTDDYGIMLEQGGYDRPFQSLSGGEQMAAALSVRLALLKQLSDIHIAFFDEPTTNMDAERRENLAQQIGRIRHFDQLFVISHDDTFEGYMDHEVRVGG